jgi:hypothetical protein
MNRLSLCLFIGHEGSFFFIEEYIVKTEKIWASVNFPYIMTSVKTRQIREEHKPLDTN